MANHFNNKASISPEDLLSTHAQTKMSALAKCSSDMPLTKVQKEAMSKHLDKLLEIHIKLSKLKRNTKERGIAIGIDLGTTHCCVAVYYNGEVITISNRAQGNALTTLSYVYFDETNNDVTIGKVAKKFAERYPKNTIYSAKRIIGKKLDNVQLQSDMKLWPFVVKGKGGVPMVEVNGNLMSPEQISAELLFELKQLAEEHLGLDRGAVKKAVITVPAYFNDGQRQATVDAGALAGLDVLSILNEPTAAAIAYSMKRLDAQAKKILVYDLGGGTFDVAVIEINGNNIEVLGVGGDTHLGGEDFDNMMITHCTEYFQRKHNIDLLDKKDSEVEREKSEVRKRIRRIQTACEDEKIVLTAAKACTIFVERIIDGLELSVDVTREDFEKMNEHYFQKTIDLVEQTLKEVKLKPEDIDDIVLVGGSSRIPKIQEMLKTFFKVKILNMSIHPDLAVAHGAAVQAALLNGEVDDKHIKQFQDVIPMSLGIQNKDGKCVIFLPKNSKFPITKTQVWGTIEDDQTSGRVKIYQGEDYFAKNNEFVGEFVLEGIPPNKAGEEQLDTTMSINELGILHVECVCRSTKGSKTLTVDERKERMSREVINRLKKSVGDE